MPAFGQQGYPQSAKAGHGTKTIRGGGHSIRDPAPHRKGVPRCQRSQFADNWSEAEESGRQRHKKGQLDPTFLPTPRPSGTIHDMLNLSPDTVAQIIIGVIAVAGSIGGAILGAREGARASLEATQAHSQETEKRQRASVRLLLRVEIDQNLANLGDLRAKLIAAGTPQSDDAGDDAGDEEEKPKFSWGSYARAFVRGVMPAWTRQVWESMTALLSPALDAKEIERVNHFYGQLETINGIRDQLTVMLDEKPHTEHHIIRSDPRTVRPTTFYNHGPGLAAEDDRIIADLLDRGNPIAEA